MNRRKFVMLGLSGAAAINLPFVACSSGSQYSPQFLGSVIPESRIREIGKAYVAQFPSESNVQVLRTLVPSSLSSINENIEADFAQGRVVVINGWVLSLTESRQAALYYLNS